MNKKMMALLFCCLATAAAACYPEDSPQPFRLEIPLSNLGSTVSNESVQSWAHWLAQKNQGLSTTFDMGTSGNDIFIGLKLEPQAVGLSTQTKITYILSPESIQFDLFLDDCSNCQFVATIFMRNAQDSNLIDTFSGTSDTFSWPDSALAGVTMTAQVLPVGNLHCSPLNLQGSAEGLKLAARDTVENVRFPYAQVMSRNGVMEATLASIPIGRDTAVQVGTGDPPVFNSADLDVCYSGTDDCQNISEPRTTVLLRNSGETAELQCWQ